jgi:hypothetical protein
VASMRPSPVTRHATGSCGLRCCGLARTPYSAIRRLPSCTGCSSSQARSSTSPSQRTVTPRGGPRSRAWSSIARPACGALVIQCSHRRGPAWRTRFSTSSPPREASKRLTSGYAEPSERGGPPRNAFAGPWMPGQGSGGGEISNSRLATRTRAPCRSSNSGTSVEWSVRTGCPQRGGRLGSGNGRAADTSITSMRNTGPASRSTGRLRTQLRSNGGIRDVTVRFSSTSRS